MHYDYCEYAIDNGGKRRDGPAAAAQNRRFDNTGVCVRYCENGLTPCQNAMQSGYYI